MSPAERARAAAVLAEEMSEVTSAMVEAGSRAASQAKLTRDGHGRRIFRENVTEDEIMTVIWSAMLAAKLSGIA